MVEQICKLAKKNANALLKMKNSEIDDLLITIHEMLIANREAILQANRIDLDTAINSGMSNVMLDRLSLSADRINAIASSVVDIAKLDSPIGETLAQWQLYNGAQLKKISVPFGLIAMIYESRPNVTIDAAAIALKSKNAIVLKGGKESIASNRALVALLKKALAKHHLPKAIIGFIDSTDRQHAAELLHMKSYVDLLIPRGSASLINWVTSNATVPVIETGAGNCHLFIDRSADFEMALSIIENAKIQRPSVCNAVEKVIVHSEIASQFISALTERLRDRVTFRAETSASRYLGKTESMTEAEKYTEYLDYTLGVIVLDDTERAIDWINQYGSHHSDGIITKSQDNAERFQLLVDSAVVYHNASTRFTDGGEFGFGAEIGIATSKLHARGPMALKEMTTHKYLISGEGQIRG